MDRILSTLFASHKEISPVLEKRALVLDSSLALLDVISLHSGTPFKYFFVYFKDSWAFS
jgi:hypothetical protein